MNFRRLVTRTAATGAVTALAGAGLVAGATTSAQADVTGSGNYTCSVTTPLTVPLTGDFGMAISTPVIPPTVTAGQSFPAGPLAVTAVLTIPASSAAMLNQFGVDHGTIDDYAAHLGTSSIGAPLNFPDAPVAQPDGSATMTGTGNNLAFTTPAAGTYDVLLPESFTFSTEVTLSPGADPTPATIGCTSTDPGNLGSVVVTKGISATAGKVAKTTKGYKATATVTRIGDDVVPAGKVLAKLGTKTVATKTLKKGKAVFALPKSAKGKKLSLIYKGDGYTKGSKATLKVK